jgi:hypothetical protein
MLSMEVPFSWKPLRAFKRLFAFIRLPLSFIDCEMNCPATVNGMEMETPVPLTSVNEGVVKFAATVRGCETVTAVDVSLMLGLWKLVVNTGALVFALLPNVVASEVPERLKVDAASVPENVVVPPDAVWLVVFACRVPMDVALVDADAAAAVATVSTAEIRVSKFFPA